MSMKPQNKLIRVISGDPGGQHDSFFATLLAADKPKRKIYIVDGMEWKFQDGQINYPTVERDLAKLHANGGIDFFVLEKNNTGLHVAQTIQSQYRIPVVGITTANNIKNRKIIQKGDVMDKTEQVGWFNEQTQKGNILTSSNPTAGVKKILSQMGSFVRKRTPSGRITYSAEGTQPDDAVMTLLVGTFYIRRHIFGDMGIIGRRQMVWKKYTPREVERDIQSALPPDVVNLGRTDIMPTGPAPTHYRIH